MSEPSRTRERVAALLACAAAILACASAPPRDVSRTDAPVDLSGEWNDVDSDLVAAGLVEDCLKTPWVEAWTRAHPGRRPTLRLYPIRNRTTAYIDYRYFTKQLEAALVRAGTLDVLAGKDEPIATSDGSDPAPPADAGADFVLNGYLLAQDDTDGQREVRAYLASIEIVEVETNRKVWIGQKRIRKLIGGAP